MAVQIETQGQLSEFVEILKRRKWQIILPALLISAIGTAVAVIIPKKYEVSTQIELRETVLTSTEQGGVFVSKLVKEAHLAQIQLKSSVRVKDVVRELNWADYLVLERDEFRRSEMDGYVDAIANDISVRVTEKRREDSLRFVTIMYANTDVDRAVEFLKALRTNWIREVLERDKHQLKNERDTLQKERRKLETLVATLNEELTSKRKQYGLSPTQPVGGTQARKEDPLVVRIADKQLKLEEVQSEISRLEASIEKHTSRRDELPEMIAETTRSDGVSFVEEYARIEQELHTLSTRLERYRPLHPKYARIQKDMQALEEYRSELRGLETEGEVEETLMANPRRRKQQDLIEDLELDLSLAMGQVDALDEDLKHDKEYLKELQDVYKDISSIQSQIDNYNAALTDTTKKYFDKVNQYAIILGPQGNPFQITKSVNRPDTPSAPNPYMIIAFAVVFGFGLGIGGTVLAEFSKNCFRGVQDISRVMVVPVLGCVNTIVTRAERRRKLLARFLLGFSSASVLGSILFVTWAWARDPELLSPEVRDAIDIFRGIFS